MKHLDSRRLGGYLQRIGSPSFNHDAQGLTRLQSAHLMNVPFHNLLVLANDGRPRRLPALPEVIDAAIEGVGGNCDRTTPPFAALLRSVGFDAHLAAATVGAPGDHFVCVAHAEGRRFLCDVGNGHPYLQPWDLDGPVQTQAFRGWRFQFDPAAPAGPTLQRTLPDGTLKTVYVVDPTPRDYADFAPIVAAHYSQTDYGPFLSGLRAVRIGQDEVLTVRDGQYARDTRIGRSMRRIRGSEAFRALLTDRFGLSPGLVSDALAVLARRRPELLAEPTWFALGRGLIDLARSPVGELRGFLQRRVWEQKSRYLEHLCGLLRRYGRRPAVWAADVSAHIDQCAASLEGPDSMIPREFLIAEGDPERALLRTRRLVGDLGRLFVDWPAIVEAAELLRERGVRLAEPVVPA